MPARGFARLLVKVGRRFWNDDTLRESLPERFPQSPRTADASTGSGSDRRCNLPAEAVFASDRYPRRFDWWLGPRGFDSR